jgi:hypothetical protein
MTYLIIGCQICGNCYHPVYLNKLKTASDYETVKEILSHYELIVDSYEQVKERPTNNKKPEIYYSGKASKHIFKSLIIIFPEVRDIVDAVAGEPGSKSDITLFREYRSRFHLQQRFKGYLAD